MAVSAAQQKEGRKVCVRACVCMRACVRTCVRACVRACVCVLPEVGAGGTSYGSLCFIPLCWPP